MGILSDPRFRVFVELTDKDRDFWESQALGTAEGKALDRAEDLIQK
jgi:hypothetical protein